MMALGIEVPFTIVLDDPSGNSFLENPVAPEADPNMEVCKTRSEATRLPPPSPLSDGTQISNPPSLFRPGGVL
jgi:hypothetical protein